MQRARVSSRLSAWVFWGVPRNVLLKLALDEVGLYGGHDNAGKAAAHDLKGALQVEYAAIPTLCAPLQVLVDYMGFR